MIGSIFIAGLLVAWTGHLFMEYTSGNAFCESCHVHPHATQSWKLGPHFDSESGFVANCVDCHLPPSDSSGFLLAKASSGARDAWGTLFKDTEAINWQAKAQRAEAVKHVFKSSCLHCHQTLFPRSLSTKGADAHLHYERKADELHCLNCHIDVGHFRKEREEASRAPINIETVGKIYKTAATVSAFENYRETIPGSAVDFEMVAIPGGTFAMGSPAGETYRSDDEGPQRTIEIESFWIGKAEVSWREYELFFQQKGIEGRSTDRLPDGKVIAVTGPTPPYGNPDQGWGRADRPAITMTFYAAQKYCEWLSRKTGKKYRLPTEAEWEYAARANTSGSYFFEGEADTYQQDGFLDRFFAGDTSVINAYVVSRLNSNGRTLPAGAVAPNPFGLLHMLGNVREFCSDFYDADGYGLSYSESPFGPRSGSEHVIRGGSFKSDPAELRVARRDQTDLAAWQRTDPQIPKSLWWYSDCIDVGFRVVCEK